MLEKILKIKTETDFDFRNFASPDDPLKHLFVEWVDYYRTKYAICAAVAPKSIVEVGVRYGYSALTFLNAAPEATYLGIDNNSESFGGRRGALDWAAEKLQGFRTAEILRADSQTMLTLPGEYFDLMHVDGQQDGDGTFHDLELGLEKARWLLVDGYFWSRENMLSATYFMEKYRNLIVGAHVVPGYAGDLLIETKRRADRRIFRNRARRHEALRDTYDSDYFLGDCGGYASFKASSGRQLTDDRLLTLFDLCSPAPGMHILDVGCGRGELSYACYKAGAHVTGLDYSRSAIEIATETFADSLGERLKFVCADVLAYEPGIEFDAILAADVVEHLSEQALDAAFARFSGWLAPGGKLIVHTWPNRIAYEHNYRQRRHKAMAAGAYLPRNPRTYYEDLMHINEQTPAKLRRSLRGHFREVAIWLTAASASGAESASGNIRERVRSAESIYALASAAPMAPIQDLMEQGKFEPFIAENVHIEAVDCPASMQAGSRVDCRVSLFNDSRQLFMSRGRFPVHLSYHWYRDGIPVVFDGLRTSLLPRLHGGERRDYQMTVQAPTLPGRYELGVTLVQEGCFWFEESSKQIMQMSTIDVV